ncbi:MAG: LLM class flavin-dependent oxidoreductase, partial [Myxococcota bacterium]
MIAEAVHAEDLGYRSVWIPESHFGEPRSLPQPLLILAAIAARTETIRLGTSSYLLPFRHPVRVAEEVAVLDQISNGRVILGVGRGFRKPLFEAMGIAPGTKRAHFERTLATLLGLFRGEPVADTGAYIHPLPLQRPHPPIWVAAFGPKGLAQAAQFGLPYLASPIEALERLEANHRLHRAALDPEIDADSLAVPAIRSVFVSEQPAALRRVREALAAQARTLAARVGGALPHAADRE